MITPSDIGYHAQLVAHEPDDGSRVFRLRVFADLLEEAGRGDDASLIRHFVEAGEEPRETLRWYYRYMLSGCTTLGGPSADIVDEGGLCVMISFRGCGVRSLDILREMPYVRHLDVSRTSVKDDDLTFLDEMSGLEVFVADATRISDRTVERLSRLPRLKWLSVTDTRITPKSVDAFVRMELQALHWDALLYDDVDLAGLRRRYGCAWSYYPRPPHPRSRSFGGML